MQHDKTEQPQDDAWLLNAEVRYEIKEVKGRWEVSLIFVDTQDPKHFLIHRIGDYRSEKLALIYVRNMQQTAAKDYRGTQKVKKDAHDINDN